MGHTAYTIRRETKPGFFRNILVCATCGKESTDTTYPECFKKGGEEMTDYKAALEQAQADSFEADLKIISLEADAAITKKRANGYREEAAE
jgi:hypothetical protein